MLFITFCGVITVVTVIFAALLMCWYVCRWRCWRRNFYRIRIGPSWFCTLLIQSINEEYWTCWSIINIFTKASLTRPIIQRSSCAQSQVTACIWMVHIAPEIHKIANRFRFIQSYHPWPSPHSPSSHVRLLHWPHSTLISWPTRISSKLQRDI